jgi:hypothetical protein
MVLIQNHLKASKNLRRAIPRFRTDLQDESDKLLSRGGEADGHPRMVDARVFRKLTVDASGDR